MDLVYEFDLWAEFGQFFEKKSVLCHRKPSLQAAVTKKSMNFEQFT